jgi:hypothetical protein
MHILDRFFNGKVYGPVFKSSNLGGAGRTRHFSGITFWLVLLQHVHTTGPGGSRTHGAPGSHIHPLHRMW